jgi:hypothetical protein
LRVEGDISVPLLGQFFGLRRFASTLTGRAFDLELVEGVKEADPSFVKGPVPVEGDTF